MEIDPLKDLQGALAKLATQRLPEPPLEALRSAIDHFFGRRDIPGILEQLQEVAIGDTRQWALDTAARMQSTRHWPWQSLWRCCAAGVICRYRPVSPWNCISTASGSSAET